MARITSIMIMFKVCCLAATSNMIVQPALARSTSAASTSSAAVENEPRRGLFSRAALPTAADLKRASAVAVATGALYAGAKSYFSGRTGDEDDQENDRSLVVYNGQAGADGQEGINYKRVFGKVLNFVSNDGPKYVKQANDVFQSNEYKFAAGAAQSIASAAGVPAAETTTENSNGSSNAGRRTQPAAPSVEEPLTPPSRRPPPPMPANNSHGPQYGNYHAPDHAVPYSRGGAQYIDAGAVPYNSGGGAASYHPSAVPYRSPYPYRSPMVAQPPLSRVQEIDDYRNYYDQTRPMMVEHDLHPMNRGQFMPAPAPPRIMEPREQVNSYYPGPAVMQHPARPAPPSSHGYSYSPGPAITRGNFYSPTSYVHDGNRGGFSTPRNMTYREAGNARYPPGFVADARNENNFYAGNKYNFPEEYEGHDVTRLRNFYDAGPTGRTPLYSRMYDPRAGTPLIL